MKLSYWLSNLWPRHPRPEEKPFYAIVELMGHGMVSGLVTKGMFVKVELPLGEVREYGRGAIYCIRHVSEAEAWDAAAGDEPEDEMWQDDEGLDDYEY